MGFNIGLQICEFELGVNIKFIGMFMTSPT